MLAIASAIFTLKPLTFENLKTKPIDITFDFRSKAKGPSTVSRENHSPSQQQIIPLSRLGINYNVDSLTQSTTNVQEKDHTDSINFANETKELKLWEYLFKKIEANLVYPSEFTERNMTGTVDAKLWFTSTGVYIENETEYDASSPYFKVLVARTLRKALQDPIPKEKLLSHSKFWSHCHFVFEITKPNYNSFEGTTSIFLQNDLHFYRHVQKSFLSSQHGPITGASFTEVPTTKGPEASPVVGIDLAWIAKKVSGTLLGGNVSTDPLEKYREDPAW